MILLKAITAAAALFSAAHAAHHPLRSKVRANFGEDRVLEILTEDLTPEVVSVLDSHGADHFGGRTEKFHFKISPEALVELERKNAKFTDTTEEWISHFETNFEDENFVCMEEDCHTRSLQDFYSSYQTLEAIHSRARALVANVEFAEIDSLGLSYEGRDQMMVQIGDHSKPLVLYWCNIHAREWLSPMFCIYMVEKLIENGGHPLLDTVSFSVVLSANPDGYLFTHAENAMWRKTRRPNPGSRCIGTDPNRNYDFNHCGPGTSNNPCSDVYCGPAPFSEVEVQNIRDYTTSVASRLLAVNDVHAYSELWMFPYGGIEAQAPEPDYSKQMKCSLAAVQAIKDVNKANYLWKYGPIWSTIYPASGSSVDWLYEELGVVYAMTAEVRGTSFQPPTNQILPSNVEVFAAMVGQVTCAAQEEGLLTTPATTPSPVPDSTPPPTCGFFFC